MWMMDDQSAVDSSSGLAIPCRLCSLTCTHLFLVFIANYVCIPFGTHRQHTDNVESSHSLVWRLGWNDCGRMMEELGVRLNVESNKSAHPFITEVLCSQTNRDCITRYG